MAIGKNILTIDSGDFIKGMSSSPEIIDGGFSPETQAVNLTSKLGAIYGATNNVTASTNLVDEIIASCEDPTYLGEDRMFLDDTGNLYSWDGSALTLEDTITADEVTAGTTDLIPFQGNFYITTKAGANGDVMQWDGSSTLDEAWWTTTKSQSALSATTPQRPMLVFEDFMFIGDANKLHRIDAGGTVSNGILELPSNQIITALGIDPGSGKMLIAVTSSADYSAQKQGVNKILIYDGYSNKPLRTIPVSGMITSFRNVGGTIFIFYQNKVGYYNGSGITFLRELDINFTGDELVYKHHSTSVDDTLYIAEGKKVLAFGPVNSSTKAWYYVTSVAENITMLTGIGDGKLGISYATASFYTFDLNGIAGVKYIYSNKYIFEREVNIREVVVYFADNLVASATGLSNFTILDDSVGGLGINLGNFVNNKSGVVRKIKKPTNRIQTSQLQVSFRTVASIGIKKIEIKYDTAQSAK